MKLIFATEARFIKNKKGQIFGDNSFNYSFWNRYLEIFNKVCVLARVKYDADFDGEKLKISNGRNVEFIELPYYIGPFGFFMNIAKIKRRVKKIISESDNAKFLCRVPGVIGGLVINQLNRKNVKYALEVVGDPDDVFAPGTIKHPLRAYFRQKSIKSLNKNIYNAGTVLYVTKDTLQKKYPPKTGVYNTFASNVKLESEFVPDMPKSWKDKRNIQIVSIGSLEQMYKAPDVVVKAIKILNRNDEFSFNLKWLGNGRYLSEIVQLAHNLEIHDKIDFIGNVEKREVYNYLKKSDLFVLASRTEGLPRAIIEAMTIGLPIVGSNVGGIPELLEDKVLVEKNNPQALADKIFELITKEDFYNQQAKRNFKESELYSEKLLSKKRKEFYKYILNHL